MQQGNPISMNFYGTSLRETFLESSETVCKKMGILFSDGPLQFFFDSLPFVEHKKNLQNKIALKYWIENHKSHFFIQTSDEAENGNFNFLR